MVTNGEKVRSYSGSRSPSPGYRQWRLSLSVCTQRESVDIYKYKNRTLVHDGDIESDRDLVTLATYNHISLFQQVRLSLVWKEDPRLVKDWYLVNQAHLTTHLGS